MSKPKLIPVLGKNFSAWEYEEQTKIKHKVLLEYYKVYATKLGNNNNVLFFDCHGGCGAYLDKDNLYYGSSIILSESAEQIFRDRKTTYGSYVCEKDKENFNNLEKVITSTTFDKKIKRYNNDFNDIIIDPDIKNYFTKYPTLFFIDPFGYFDMPMQNFKELMAPFGNELVINFMFDFLNRGISVLNVDENQLTNFFGSNEWKKARDLNGKERELFLITLYKQKLKEHTGAKYVFAYRLCYPDRSRTYYYLIHATNHIAGITLMKSCFSFINNGHVEYLGKRNNKYSLFDIEGYQNSALAIELKSEFTGYHMTFDQLWDKIVEDTGYLEKDLRKTLRKMEKKDEIRIERVESKQTGIRGKDIINF
ncbi:MAG: three-Cys-motif partner protein TcmP [Fusobacteriaceae bacterium]|jgi:three-Cys-motif partner protein|nr:three-Cys-motif partner protein TcmP [Fusobacteriaceae bacterium]